MHPIQIHAFPSDLLPILKTTLGAIIFDIHPLSGGTQRRTFLAGTSDGFCVVRVENAPGIQLQRGLAAQQMAHTVDFPMPTLIAHEHTTIDSGDYFWTVEEFVQGVEFDPPGFDATIRTVIGRQVGEQLRKLHSIELPTFGRLSPTAEDQSADIGTWLAKRRTHWEQALPLATNAPNLPERFATALATLQSYTGTPRLSHGDFAGTNVLVNESQLVAAVDWEWAQGADPALDFAWWHFWHDDRKTVDAMIEGYAPTDNGAFTQRVLAHALVHALDTLLIYHGEDNAKGQRYCRDKIHQYCR